MTYKGNYGTGLSLLGYFVITCQRIFVQLTFCEEQKLFKFYYMLDEKLKNTLLGVSHSFSVCVWSMP